MVEEAETNRKDEEPQDKLEAIEDIKRGLESMRRNAGKPAEEFFSELFDDEGIPEQDKASHQ